MGLVVTVGDVLVVAFGLGVDVGLVVGDGDGVVVTDGVGVGVVEAG